MIKLTRPLVAYDLETDGLVNARIVEIGFVIHFPDGRPVKRWNHLVNPGRQMSQEVIDKHGITNEMVANAPGFHQLAPNLAKGLTDVDFVGYNVMFDLKTTSEEMQRVGVPWSYANAFVIDGYRLWQRLEPRSLSDAVRAFLHREPTKAHRAEEDAQDALDVVLAQIQIGRSEETRGFLTPLDTSPVEKLASLCYPKDPNRIDPDGKFVWHGSDAAIAFGKHSGTLLKNLPLDYLTWMLKGTFSPEVRKLCTDALHNQFPIRPSRGGSSNG